MYFVGAEDSKKVKKEKGINKNVVQKIEEDLYGNVLFNIKVMRHKIKRIQNKLHKIGTYVVCKLSLSCLDDKIYILDDGINTLGYFHEDTF